MDSIVDKPTRGGKKKASATIDSTLDDTIDSVVAKPTRGRKKAAEKVDTTMEDINVEPSPEPEPEPEPAPAPALVPKTKAKKAAPKAKRASSASTTTKTTRGKKRTSDQAENTEIPQLSPKRSRQSSVSSFPDSLLAGTPKRTPTELAELDDEEPAPAEPEAEDVEVNTSSMPASLLIGTPKKTPTRPKTPEANEIQQEQTWDPIDIDEFFSNTAGVAAFMNDIVIDAGLDAIVPAGTSDKELAAAVHAGLTEAEKKMTIEQWVLYNAKRGEEKLRQACEKQILAFDAEAKKARAAIEAIPTY